MLAVDLCMLDRQNVAFIRRHLDTCCEIPPDSVLIHATHTHSGPAPNDRYLFGFTGFEACQADVEAFLKSVPKAAPMHVLRTAVSMLALSDPDANNVQAEPAARKAVRLMAQTADWPNTACTASQPGSR